MASKKDGGKSEEKWVRAQQKAFTHWVNIALSKRSIRIESLEEGFNNGLNLIALVEILTAKQVTKKYAAKPALRIHKITNCNIGFDHLKDPNIGGMKPHMITISAENMVDGNSTMLLGFCWTLLKKFQNLGGDEGKGKANSYEQGLLDWVKKALAGSTYSDIHQHLGDNFNFKSEAFKNGKVFLGLLNELSPGTIDYNSYGVNNHLPNCRDALELSEKHADVPAIIDPDDLASGNASEKEIVLYLSLWYKMFNEKQISFSSQALQSQVTDIQSQLKSLTEENEALRLANQKLSSTIEEDTARLNALRAQQEAMQQKLTEEMELQLRELQDKFDSDKDSKTREITRLKESVAMGGQGSADKVKMMEQNIADVDKEREKLEEELAAFKAQLEKEKAELDEKNKALQKNIAGYNKDREGLEAQFQKNQQDRGKKIFHLRKAMLHHLNNMNEWKVFLNQQGMTYESEDLHINLAGEISVLEHEKIVEHLASNISEEDSKLQEFLKKAKEEAAPAKDSKSKAESSGGDDKPKKSVKKSSNK